MKMARIRVHSSRVSPAPAADVVAWRRDALSFASRSSPCCRRSRPSQYLGQPEHHPDAGGGEAGVPVDLLRDVAGDDLADQAAAVDAHVEDREARVATAIALLVQRADDRAHIGFEQARAGGDEREAAVERREGVEREGEVAQRDQDAAEQDGVVLADQPIRDETAENCRAPGAARVGAVDRGRLGRAEAHAAGADRRDEIQDEEGPHPVIAEALPHLREEQGREPAGVSCPASGVERASHGVGRHGHASYFGPLGPFFDAGDSSVRPAL